MTTPQDILSSMNRPSGWDGWIATLTGGFTPLVPKIEDINSEDIIWGLAGTWRFGGMTNPRMTIAEHCVGVSHIIELLWGREYAAAGLLHDACEAYTHDIQSPVRKFVTLTMPDGEVISWDELDRRLNILVFKKYGVDPALLDHPQVRAADILSVTFEKAQSESLDSDADWGLPPVPPELANFGYTFDTPETAARKLKARWVELGLPLC